jgi:hypothetical protein
MNGGRSKASDGAIVAASLYTTVQLPSFRKLENDVALSNEYVAGLLDGEGSIGLYRDVRVPNTYKPKIETKSGRRRCSLSCAAVMVSGFSETGGECVHSHCIGLLP